MWVAVELEGVSRDTVVQHEDHLISLAPGGGGGRARGLARSGGGDRAGRGEASGPCAVGGDPEAPGAVLGNVEVDSISSSASTALLTLPRRMSF